MTRKSLYDLLQIRADASAEQIRQAYERELARLDPAKAGAAQIPDREIQLVAVKEAYSILGNEQQRNAYDARQRAAVTANMMLAGELPLHEETPLWHRPQVWFGVAIAIFALIGLSTWRSARVENQAAAMRRAVELQERAQSGDLAERERRMSEADGNRQRDREAEAARRVEEQNQREFEEARRRTGYAVEAQNRQQERDEADARRAQRAEEYEQARLERQRQEDARRQLEHDKAYLRELEASNSRRRSGSSGDLNASE
ncbi:DnaJ domain-containing protein [Niveibacterium sp. SC-1]|uniref:DnaJ domain-containing protein n=1 Tax=Niveibacterium sp. SC-1 TaxID=3135646 RepID=UPI00311E9420